MTIDEWLTLLESENDKTLHEFNFSSERCEDGNCSDFCDAYRAAHQAFEQFLSALSLDDFDSPSEDVYDSKSTKILKKFFRSEIRKPHNEAACFSGQSMKCNKRLVTIAGLNRLGPREFNILSNNDLENIKRILYETNKNPEIQYDESENYTIESLELINSTLQLAISDILPYQYISIEPQNDDIKNPPIGIAENVIWLADSEELKSELGASPTISAIARSGFAKDIKCILGLYSEHDEATDSTTPAKFRALFSVQVDIDDQDLHNTAQPGMFSNGFDNLFVSRNPLRHASRELIGQTVRLKTDNCADTMHTDCLCGAAGVGEVTAPLSVVRSQSLTVSEAYFVSSTSLNDIKAPKTNLIRRKNAA